MTLEYFLYNPNMTNIEGKYLARCLNEGTVDLERLTQLVAAGLSADKREIQLVLTAAFDTIEAILSEGQAVDLAGIVRMSANIRGTFDNANDNFDLDKHKIAIVATPGKRIKKIVANNIQTHKVARPTPIPNILQFKDIISDSYDVSITPGGIGQINGGFLGFDSDDTEQGLFIADSAGLLTEIKVTNFQKATARELVFAIPDLGGYSEISLIVRKRNTANGAIVAGQLETLTVV